MNNNEYYETFTTMRDLQEGDLVFGTDGEWHEIKILPIQTKELYEVKTDSGNVICSYDHEWNLYDKDGFLGTYRTIDILNDIIVLNGCSLGKEDGPILINIQMAKIGECRCVEVNSDDHQFEILTDEGWPVFTHNCQGRVVCGRVDTTASLMALGNTLGTAIDGSIKGRGIVSSNGVMSNCQIYFDSPEWIDKWYADRGFDPLGYPPEGLEQQDILLGDDDEEIVIDESLMEMDFEGIHKEINNAKKQEFDNV